MALSQIKTAGIADSAVTGAKIAAGTVVASDIADGTVSTAKLADDAVDTDAIVDDAVTSGKLGAGACDAAALGVTAGAVTASKAMVVDSSKDISGGRHFTASGNITGGEVMVGGANKWKLRVNGSNMELQKYNSGSSAWETKQVFTP